MKSRVLRLRLAIRAWRDARPGARCTVLEARSAALEAETAELVLWCATLESRLTRAETVRAELGETIEELVFRVRRIEYGLTSASGLDVSQVRGLTAWEREAS